MPSVAELLEREGETVDLERDHFERLLRRRDRKERNRRMFAAVLAIVLTLLSVMGLLRAFGSVERPATEPTPKPPGIFSEVGGRIVYGNQQGIWAVDPSHRSDPETQIHLSTERGTPLAWSSDGSRLLIQGYTSDPQAPGRLFVLNADGTETYVTTILDPVLHGGFVNGGSFSPDGSQVIYADRSSIYVVDSHGGTPRILFHAGRRWSPSCGCIFLHPWVFNPTYSPDGTQIAYSDGIGDNSHQLRVMNADGSSSRVLVNDQRGATMHNLAWSPDGERIMFGLGTSLGIYFVGADGSALTHVVPDASFPYWSPDGSRISYQPCSSYSRCRLAIADADGTHVVKFGYGSAGPWNPLVQPESEVAEVTEASESLTLTWRLLVVVAVLVLVAGTVLIRRRMMHRS